MTQQYLAGELSLILGDLQAATTDEASVVEVACLRQRAETGLRPAMVSVAVRALEVADCGAAVFRMGTGVAPPALRLEARSRKSIQEEICWDEAALDRIHGQTELFKYGEAQQDRVPGLPKDHAAWN